MSGCRYDFDLLLCGDQRNNFGNRGENKIGDGTHPYKKDDILVWDPHGTGRAIAAYQVIETTDKTVQLREIDLDADRNPIPGEFIKGRVVIRRKPFISYYSKKMEC